MVGRERKGAQHPGTCLALTRCPEMSKCWDGSDQDTRDYARVEGSGRVLGEKGSSPPFTERLCYTHCPRTKAARSVNHERNLTGKQT